MTRRGPLAGLVVADFSRVLAGPFCTMLLADHGARVIKVEEPLRGDETRRWGPPFVGGESAYFLSINRNKESLTLNLKAREGRAIARELVRRADVVVDNFRPSQRQALGLSHRSTAAVNRRRIHCSISGFEPGAADFDVPGYDLLAQACAGLMTITGDPAGPPTKTGVALSDVLTGHFAFGAISAALRGREVSGKGEVIEVSLFGSTLASLVNVAQSYLVTRLEPVRHGNAHPSIVPYQSFEAADRTFVLAAGTDRHYAALCTRVLEREDLLAERFSTNAQRVAHRDELLALLAGELRLRSAAEWVERCRLSDIPAALVEDLEGVFSQPSAQRLLGSFEHPSAGRVSTVLNPVAMSGKRPRLRSAPPRLGQHTTRVLRELGYDATATRRLRNAGIV